jgi:hypothetical protein
MGQAAMTTNDEAEQLRRSIDQQRNALGRDLEALGDHVSPGRVIERRRMAVSRRVRSMKDSVMGAADQTGERVGGAGSSVAEGAGSLIGAVTDAPDAVKERTAGSPLAMGIISFGLGFVAASVLPATRREQELAARVEPTLERAAQDAGAMAREGMEELRPVAEEAASKLGDDAKDATQAIQDRAREGMAEVREQAAPAGAGPSDQTAARQPDPFPPRPSA